jgi:glycosyltransferase involved in cell wall biosynthesis
MNEKEFNILPIAKTYDAVYNARMVAYKRHYLCQNINSILFVYYFWQTTDQEYCAKMRSLMPHAHFANDRPGVGEYHWLNEGEVAGLLNQSRVGLCLSDAEGAMKASVEYLLCGLPVVTTPSKGGRDVYFEEPFAVTAPAEPQAIAEAVQRLIEAKIEPREVRAAVLRKINADRDLFISLVQSIYDEVGVRRCFLDEWPTVYVNGHLMGWNQRPDDFLRNAGLI